MTTPRRLNLRLGPTAVLLAVVVTGSLLAPTAAQADPTSATVPPSPTATSTATSTATARSTPTTGTTTSPTTTPTTSPATTSSPTTSTTTGPASATTTPAPAGSSSTNPAEVVDDTTVAQHEDLPLTPEQVAAQLAQAAALRAQLKATDASLAVATEQLQVVGALVAAALEQVATAQAEEKAALADRARQLKVLETLRTDLYASQEELGRWARTAYTIGGPMASYEAWLLALGGATTSEVGHDLGLLEQVGVDGSKQLRRLEAAATLQRVATRQSQLAAATAQAARMRADAAAEQAQALLTEQRLALAELQLQQARLLGVDNLTAQQVKRLAQAEALIKAAGGVASATGGCAGLDTSSYANGSILIAALCPLWGAPGQHLRADAAADFDRLAKAYAAEYGSPLCVTDSYRTLAAQISVYGRKPGLAAKPGTSNHGWGVALDLCGGIQSFGTAQHAWMLAHAPLYGWFHPAWAGPAGSRPEPWHWEYAGAA